MKRDCIILIESGDGKRAIYLDKINADEIKRYIKQDSRHRKKFKFISDIILNGLRNADVYGKEEINEKCKGITAMKFFKGQENDRIYCKEIHSSQGVFVVVAAILFEKKKTQKLKQAHINLIETISTYDYEF